MARATFKPNRAGIEKLFYSPNAPVQRHLERVAEAVAVDAVASCPSSQPKEGDGGRKKLRDTIEHHVGPPWTSKPGGHVVIALSPIAALVHKGTRPHMIVPRSKQSLRFEVSTGEVVFAKVVHHPGTRPQPWLRDALLRHFRSF